MYPRINYEMNDEQLKTLMSACRPTACILIGGSIPSSPQENANNAWTSLGVDMGFDSLTVQPRNGMGTKCFTAVPSETEDQKKIREAKEQYEKKSSEIIKLKALVATTKNKIDELSQSMK